MKAREKERKKEENMCSVPPAITSLAVEAV